MSNKTYFLPPELDAVGKAIVDPLMSNSIRPLRHEMFGGFSSTVADLLPYPCFSGCAEESCFYCVYCHKYICFNCAITHFGDGHHKEAILQRQNMMEALKQQAEKQKAEKQRPRNDYDVEPDLYRYVMDYAITKSPRHIMAVTPEDLETK